MKSLILLVILSALALVVGCGDEPSVAAGGVCDFSGGDGSLATPRLVTALALSPGGESLWIGDQEGVTRVDRGAGAVQSWGAGESGLASDTIAALAVTRAGEVWAAHDRATCAGTPQGFCGLSRLEASGQAWSAVNSANSELIDDRVAAVGQAPDGVIWAGTASGAAFSEDGRSWRAYFDWQDCARPGSQCAPLFSFTVADLAFDGVGATWLAIEQQALGVSPKPGGVARRSAGGLTDTWDRAQGLPSNRAGRVVIDGEGRAWAAGVYGAAVLDEGEGRFEVEFEEAVLDMVVDGQGRVWLGTERGARVRQGPGAWIAITTAEGLPDDRVEALASEGALVCLGTSGGAACYDTARCAWSYE